MAQEPAYLYLIAIGSNKRLPQVGNPWQIVERAIVALETTQIDVFMQSSILQSRPIGPSLRKYANAAALVKSSLAPDAILKKLIAIEHHFGRQRTGQNWRDRTLDLDIILWSGGSWISAQPDLHIPHREYTNRAFVLGPCTEIAPDWRDPVNGLTLRQLFHRLKRPKPLDRQRSPL
jgi:2-amino-4-hydroxy-6-hydroxymethyldihydropteridine diphosphokinase